MGPEKYSSRMNPSRDTIVGPIGPIYRGLHPRYLGPWVQDLGVWHDGREIPSHMFINKHMERGDCDSSGDQARLELFRTP